LVSKAELTAISKEFEHTNAELTRLLPNFQIFKRMIHGKKFSVFSSETRDEPTIQASRVHLQFTEN